MRKKVTAVLLLSLGLLLLLSLPASALPSLSGNGKEEPQIGTESNPYWDALIQIAPPEAEGALGEGVTDVRVGLEYLYSLVLGSARGGWGGALRLLLSLVGLTLLGGVAALLCKDADAQTRPALSLLSSAAMALGLYTCLGSVLSRTAAYLEDLLTFSEGLAPILGGVLVSGGSVGTAAVATGSLSALLLILEKLCVGVLSPLLGISLAFSLLGAISPSLRLDGITKCLRGTYLTLLGVMCTVATASFSMQSVLSATKDSLAMKTARYAVGNMIPIVGGTLGASLGTLGASLAAVKNGVGIGAVAVVLSLAVPCLVELYLSRLSLSLAEAFSRLLGFETGEKLLGEFRSAMDMLLGVTAFTSLSFLLYLAVFVKTALPYGL